jgi:hypothetical protein
LPALNWILLAAAIMLVAAATLFIAGERTWTVFAGPADQGPVDFATLELRTSPNQYLVCPPGTCTARADLGANGQRVRAWLADLPLTPTD